MKSALPDFSQAKVLVVGDLMLDRYWYGDTGRISPEAPVPVVKVGNIEDRPGGAANVAVNIAALGAQVSLLGLVGADDNAKALENALTAREITSHLVACEGYETITKLRVMSRNQQLMRCDFERTFADIDKTDLLNTFRQLVAQVDIVILSDYLKGTLAEVAELIAIAKGNDKMILVDPKGNDFGKYRGATLITPNRAEFETVVGACQTEAELSSKATTLRTNLSLTALLLTRSEQGMSLYTTESDFHLPAIAREVYDVTGAGDTVVATLACALAVKQPMEMACQFANHAASIVVGKLGTSVVTPTELALSLQAKSHQNTGVMNAEQLKAMVLHHQANGETIVMTNGCFDILHAGHVSYLQAAAELGDRLIVAVNSDASVSALKGEGRPVNPLERRMAVLAGLGAVDYVVPFDAPTPRELIAYILPDLLVKGGDYKIDEIAGGAEVQANGGEVRVLHFEEGVSTTQIIQQIVGG